MTSPDAAFEAALQNLPKINHWSGDPGDWPRETSLNQMRAIWNARGEADAQVWRCFHCGEVFTTTESAELHFGRSERDQPACQISIEHIRWLEQQHHRGVQDDTEALRTIRSLASEHEILRRRAEEEGYARGLADAKKHPEELGLTAAPPLSGG